MTDPPDNQHNLKLKRVVASLLAVRWALLARFVCSIDVKFPKRSTTSYDLSVVCVLRSSLTAPQLRVLSAF